MRINEIFTSNIRRTVNGYALRGLSAYARKLIEFILLMTGTFNEDRNMKSPKFLSIIDNFFFVAVLLPVLGWGFLIIFFKYLPNAVSREDLNLLWGYSVPLFLLRLG